MSSTPTLDPDRRNDRPRAAVPLAVTVVLATALALPALAPASAHTPTPGTGAPVPVLFRDPAPTPAAGAATVAARPALTGQDGGGGAATNRYPLRRTFQLHSLPGSAHTIYLDFDGGQVADTAWNAPDVGLPAGTYPGWNPGRGVAVGRDPGARLGGIQDIWARVAEDYAPFDVDVTTEDPGPDALDRTSLDDPRYGTRVLLTSSTAAMRAACSPVCSGSAWFDVFDTAVDHDYYQPAFVFPAIVGNDTKDIAEVVSHEVGHNFGLLHDGIGTSGYFGGRRGWAPIMGAGYGQPVTQWSRGTYPNATQTQDDLAIIAANGAPLRTDEAPDTPAGAGPGPAGPAYITTDTDVDVYTLPPCPGPVTVTAAPAPTAPNLDIRLTLVGADQVVVAVADPPFRRLSRDRGRGLGATLTAPPGSYFVAVEGVGAGGPAPAYDGYASVGAYTLTSRCAPRPGRPRHH